MQTPSQPRLKTDFTAIVVGAGFAGLYMLYKLRQLGISAKVFESGNGVGGTWYWNRYPGARCDVESMQYCFSFSDAMQQEWEWTERYPGQAEILRYIEHVAERFDLLRDIQFNTTIVAASFDEAHGSWQVLTNDGKRVTSQFCIMATGALSAARTPEFEGLSRFKGTWYHTGHWPHEAVDFKGNRVAVIGTGSSGIQAIPVIAAAAEHLYVFQRTPNFSIPAWNGPLSRASQAEFKKDYPRHRATAKATRSGILYEYSERSALEVTEEERRQEFEARWKRGGANFTHAFSDIFRDRAANDLAAEFVRNKIREIVKDPQTAAKLLPRDHPIGTKCICVDTNYYATFNRPNVTLIDVRDTPIIGIAEYSIDTQARRYEVDKIVFATGYDALTGALVRIEISGRSAQTLKEKWKFGPKTYLGLMSAGFPNLFMITGPGSPSVLTNVVMAIEQHVEWIADCLDYMKQRHLVTLEPTPDAEEAWGLKVDEVARATLFPDTNSWYTGANIPGKPRVFLPFVGGFGTYTDICRDVAAQQYRGFDFA